MKNNLEILKRYNDRVNSKYCIDILTDLKDDNIMPLLIKIKYIH